MKQLTIKILMMPFFTLWFDSCLFFFNLVGNSEYKGFQTY